MKLSWREFQTLRIQSDLQKLERQSGINKIKSNNDKQFATFSKEKLNA